MIAAYKKYHSKGFEIVEFLWTFNMPTDHPRVSFTDVFVPDDALFGEVGRGLSLAQCFVHENRIRQAASSLAEALGQDALLYVRLRDGDIADDRHDAVEILDPPAAGTAALVVVAEQ